MRNTDRDGLTAKGRRRREALRLKAAGWFAQGAVPPEVARQLQVSSKMAYPWQQAWREGGAEALAPPRGASGQRCKLSPQCREKPADYLEQGPAAHGWDQDQVWTGAPVVTLIGRKSHASNSVSGATRLTHRTGFTPQVPARRTAERNDKAATSWKEVTWTEVKPPGRPAAAGSTTRTRPGSHTGRRPDVPGDGTASPRS